MQWVFDVVKELDVAMLEKARLHQNNLTKPPGSLGMLEQAAIRLCAMQGSLSPSVERIFIAVFAGDHGIAAEGVSAFPQAVTVEMIRNFSNGGAAISVLARQLGAGFRVINMGTVSAAPQGDNVEHLPAGPGTGNFLREPAMTAEQLRRCFSAGKTIVDRAADKGLDLFIGGEMGIGNTASASAICAALLNCPVADMVGPGTGLDSQGVAHKITVIEQALAWHDESLATPEAVLQAVGGFEIAALCGAYIRCAQRGIPVLVDGFITTAAALCAVRLNPEVKEWLMFSHQSAEPAHRLIMDRLGGTALLQLDMRLGEASGAAVAAGLLRAACALHNEMASFSEAGVSTAG